MTAMTATTALTAFGENIWTVSHPLRVAAMDFGTRMSVLRLPSGRLTLISPVPIDDELASSIEALGPVDTIIAPNLLHHLYFNAACERWPEARALVPEGLKEKTSILDRAVVFAEAGAIEDALFWQRIKGAPAVGEHVFIYPQEQTLIVTDIAFNFGDHPQWWLRTFMRLNRAYGHFGPSRLLKSQIKDEAAFCAGLASLLDHQWDKIIVAHGRPIDQGGRATFQRGFARFLPES